MNIGSKKPKEGGEGNKNGRGFIRLTLTFLFEAGTVCRPSPGAPTPPRPHVYSNPPYSWRRSKVILEPRPFIYGARDVIAGAARRRAARMAGRR